MSYTPEYVAVIGVTGLAFAAAQRPKRGSTPRLGLHSSPCAGDPATGETPGATVEARGVITDLRLSRALVDFRTPLVPTAASCLFAPPGS